MVQINEMNIYYTLGDTFDLSVNVDELYEGETLELVIAKGIYSQSLIDNLYAQSEGGFRVTLENSDISRLEIGEYLYKMAIISPDGDKVTEISGCFVVKWGV